MLVVDVLPEDAVVLLVDADGVLDLVRLAAGVVERLSTPDAVRTGLVRTGRMISSAALLLIVVTGAFALSQLQTMRFLGVGMIVALLVDATVVRLLLVPAVLRLFGDAAWWAPAALRGVRHRAGPRPDDQPLHTQRHRDVEQQGGRREPLGGAGAVDQDVRTEVHADRDEPQ